jgi:hypothetical protein
MGTKYSLAEMLANRFPELADRLPPKRRIGDGEHSRMSIFDAVALVLVSRKGGDKQGGSRGLR